MDQATPPPPGTPLRRAFLRAGAIWVTMLLFGLLAITYLSIFSGTIPFITYHYFINQDLYVAILLGLMCVAAAQLNIKSRVLIKRGAISLNNKYKIFIIALLAAIVCYMGSAIVFSRFPLSADEFWAKADGRILASGRGLAPIAVEWRDYASALLPMFTRITPDGWWASTYLPVNAALQYLGGPFTSPLLTGLAVVLGADLARRLLPDEPQAPIFCAVLLATSSQVLVTGMTPYAMSAHLAFNLSWLWLILWRDWRAQAVAAILAVLAVGLHQIVFFPLFALPFLFEAWREGRRAEAGFQTLVIGVAFAGWAAYDKLLYILLDVEPITQMTTGASGTAPLTDRFYSLILDFNVFNFALMDYNIIRFLSWENVLVLPLLCLLPLNLIYKPGIWRGMIAGIFSLLIMLTFVVAFQGHGWGYRYTHGVIGSICLLATYGWFTLPKSLRDHPSVVRLINAGIVLSLALVLLRGWQAANFASPYIQGDREIERIDADVVIIDAPRYAYSNDLVRNDPFLQNSPKRMDASELTNRQLANLCKNHRVAYFTNADARRLGLLQPESGRVAKRKLRRCGSVQRVH